MDFFKELRNCLEMKLSEQPLNHETAYCKSTRKLLSLSDADLAKILKWPISELLEECTEREHGVLSAMLYLQEASCHLIASYLREKLKDEVNTRFGWSEIFTKGFLSGIVYLSALSDKELLRHVGYNPEITDRGFYKGYQAAFYTMEDIYINFMEGNADAD